MPITIEPYTIENSPGNDGRNLTYWGVYLDKEQISLTSTKEKAEETKQWMENWLQSNN